MTRIGKYMVFNPKKGKPYVYYDTYEKALRDAKSVSWKERQDVLVLKVVAKVETTQDIAELIKEFHDMSLRKNCVLKFKNLTMYK